MKKLTINTVKKWEFVKHDVFCLHCSKNILSKDSLFDIRFIDYEGVENTATTCAQSSCLVPALKFFNGRDAITADFYRKEQAAMAQFEKQVKP